LNRANSPPQVVEQLFISCTKTNSCILWHTSRKCVHSIACSILTKTDLLSLSQVTIDGPQPTPVQAGVVRAGVCAFTYHAHAAGTYTVTASIHGIHVRNSPAVVVASIAEACPSQCEVKGTPLTLSTVRRFLMFMVWRYAYSRVARWDIFAYMECC